ncbi:histidine phosphatase family protein [Jeotgalibacillus haloalkalitolerans]|uniref:Histidine phosphatase family protein n=1 Tax=Jeotgalibacillus haloalkalitolerans TaxID=3104292 RepID=A0ABU5KNX8_9BACL|nr:histidine phosphatase family protein [Jeotgalibacillus sp. HH7-29]MDZ5712661.1 histidine phosphatase family protein [Jeotgalibacillus sp. HH7-29]
MEIVFVRHAQGEHTLQLPESLQLQNPALTDEGILQAARLPTEIPLTERDIIVTSPVRRTMQTASVWSQSIDCRKIVSPLVSPRMFPQKPDGQTLPCDRILNKDVINKEFPNFVLENDLHEKLWISGINTLPEQAFHLVAQSFLKWCKRQNAERICVVSHDGTITSYRQLIKNEKLTREDFLKDAGWVREIVHL